MDDANGQPLNKSFNWNRNQRKVRAALQGLCEGLAAGGALDDLERGYLAAWVNENIELIDSRLSKLILGRINGDIDSALFAMMRNEKIGDIEAANWLLGLLQGITADERVSEEECVYLKERIGSLGIVRKAFPWGEVYNYLDGRGEKNVATEEGRQGFQAWINLLTGGGDGAVAGMAAQLTDSAVEGVEFIGKTFCVTGRFIVAPRAECVASIELLGGLITRNVIRDLDYLVVGLGASRDWVCTSYGRKLEKAWRLREMQKRPAIISEGMLVLGLEGVVSG